MDIYSIALFLHITGALGLSVALGLEWIALRHIRSAALPDQVRPWMGVLKSTNSLGFPCMLAMVITGFYMMLAEWGETPWILATLGSLVLVIVLSVALTRPRMMAIGQTLAAEKGPLSAKFHDLANGSLLWTSIQTRMAIVLGIVFLKVVKPDAFGSLLVFAVAVVVGIVSALPMFRAREHAKQAA